MQLSVSADNVALPAFTAVCLAAVLLLMSTGRAAISRYLLPTVPTAANPPVTCSGCMMGRTERWMDGCPTVS